jgi:phosphopantetheine--protein transferase-like protein
MDQSQWLCQTVAAFLKVDPATIRPELPLAGERLQGSIGRAALDAALRRGLGITCEAVYSARTYGELESALLGASGAIEQGPSPSRNGSPPRPASREDIRGEREPAAEPVGAFAIACGVDMELVANLPAVNDYWEDGFYTGSFTQAEIVYCTMQPDPRPHFAARWCAKEALKKCDPALLREPMSALELVNDGSGPVSLCRWANGAREILPFAVSVSHTSVAAVAVVVGLSRPGPSPSPSPPPGGTTGQARRGVIGLFALLLSIVAVIAGVWALLRTW